jgi:hypothetical protein
MMVSLVCVIFNCRIDVIVAGANQQGKGRFACHNPLRLREESHAMPEEEAAVLYRRVVVRQ